MAISAKRVEILMRLARVAISNAMDHVEIKEKILEYGYNDARLQEGKELFTQLSQKYQDQQHKRGEQIEASNRVRRKLNQEKKRYMVYRKLAKKVLFSEEDEGMRKILGIDGEARNNMDGVLKEGRQFYEGIVNNEQIMAKLARFALTKEKLQELLNGLDELMQLDKEQESIKGAAQKATKDRNEIFKKLNLWMGGFVIACRDALKDDDQILEKMGIKAYSEDYKRRGKKKEDKEEQEEAQETVNSETGEIS